MKSKLNIAGILLLAASVFIAAGCGKKEDPKQAENIKLNQVVPVSVTQVQSGSIDLKKTFAGNLEGIKQSKIIAKIAERIVSIRVKVGDRVGAGQVVIQLDKSGPSSQYLQAQANLENSKRELDRMTALLKEGAVSQQAVDQANTAYTVAKANFDASRSTVDLTSPISGQITAINVNPGDWVNPGTELATVAEIGQMLITFNVNETEVQAFKPGTTVYIYSEFSKEQQQKGKVTEINRSATVEARSFQIKAQFPNTKDSFFKPGMFVKVDVVLESRAGVLTVPTEAVVSKGNESVVYVINNGRALERKIKTGLSTDEVMQVLEGLNAGDTVVTAGMNNLSDSTRVSVNK